MKPADSTRQDVPPQPSAPAADSIAPTTDGIIAALGERVAAQIDRGGSTLQLALAETRLAAVSAALLIGLAVAAALLVIVVWLLLCALAGYGLWSLGLALPWTLLVLLLLHGLALAGLAWTGRRLANDLAFAETRRVLRKAPPEPVPEPSPESVPEHSPEHPPEHSPEHSPER